jgi:hypothetical protein
LILSIYAEDLYQSRAEGPLLVTNNPNDTAADVG